MEGSAPTFWCAAADVPAVAHGDALTIRSVDYLVVNVRPDGTGVMVLRLQKQ